MLTHADNELLCRVEGDAPMGQLMRRHWIPACMSEEVAEPDGAPVRVRLLGEDLVAFRDTTDGSAWSTSTARTAAHRWRLGRNEECGLRCLYHGWKIDVEGNVVDMPSEPQCMRAGAQGQAPGLSLPRGGRLRLGLDGPARRDARVRAAGVGADAATSGPASSRSTSAATGRRCSKARSIPRTARACIRPTWCRRKSTAPGRPPANGCGRRPTRRRACSCSAPSSAFATSRSAARSTTRRRTTTCASRCSSRRSPC